MSVTNRLLIRCCTLASFLMFLVWLWRPVLFG
uniref:Uncharacterized protein n=1 Tax=Arundo donax TaxID=35708 RepID=A0A0A9FBN6_ARUDO